jgi:hypothetical protein
MTVLLQLRKLDRKMESFSLMSEVAINPLKCKLAQSYPEKDAAGPGGGWDPGDLRTLNSGLIFLLDLIQLLLRLRRQFHLIRV